MNSQWVLSIGFVRNNTQTVVTNMTIKRMLENKNSFYCHVCHCSLCVISYKATMAKEIVKAYFEGTLGVLNIMI